MGVHSRVASRKVVSGELDLRGDAYLRETRMGGIRRSDPIF